MFPSDLEPAQIARKLVSVMESRTQQNESTLVAPSRYTVRVNPADYTRLLPHRGYLEQEWAALLGDVAARVGIGFGTASGAPAVEMISDQNVVAGAIEIEMPEPSATYILRALEGKMQQAEFTIRGTARVGRSKENDIFVVDPSVSRNHAVLDVRGGKLVVRDAGSTNGTFVNGERVQLRTLQDGDVVAFGKAQFVVRPDR